MVSDMFIGAAGGGGITTYIFVGLLVVLVVVLLVVPMFTNKKRAKQTMDLHNSLMPGDVIKTVGGIIGTIKEIRQISPNDREMIIETGEGDNTSTMTFDIQALYQVLVRAPRPEKAPEVFDEHSAAADETAEAEEHAHDEADTAVKTEEVSLHEPAIENDAVAEEKPEEQPSAEEPAESVVTEEAKVEADVAVGDDIAKAEEAAVASDDEAKEQEAAEKPPVSAPKAAKAGASNTARKTGSKKKSNNSTKK